MSQRTIPIADVELSENEIEAAIEVLESGYLRQGPRVEEFEESFADYVGSNYAVAVSSGTAALHLAYLAELEEGEEVLVPSFSHISTASMVSFAGGIPIFCDIDPRTFTIDIEDLEKKITDQTSTIVPVHLFGNAADVSDIKGIADENDLSIIWDAAQAHGTKYEGKDVGSFDDMVTYSFYPTKNMITGEGGMVTTNNEELYEELKLLRSHGQSEKYYHPSLGLNYRMSDVEAAIGVKQLEKLDSKVSSRRKNASFLTKELSEVPGIVTPFIKDEVSHSYHQYTILVEEEKWGLSRDGFMKTLDNKGIGSAVHYPRPLHTQPAFEKKYGKTELPVVEQISEKILSLPVHPHLNEEDLKRIVDVIKEISS